jgi:hypothetical protein
MNRNNIFIIIIFFLNIPNLASAQSLSACAATFYDPTFYNWLSFRNTCSQGIFVTFKTRDAIGSGDIDIGPGKVVNTGLSQKEINNAGGIIWAVCKLGEVAYEPDGRNKWLGRTRNFICR